MTKRKLKSQTERLDPWVYADLLAKTLLQDDRTTLNKVGGYLRSRDLKRVCDLASVPYSEHLGTDINTWLAERQISCLFRKNESLTSDTASETAKIRFEAAERKCRITNKRIDYYARHTDRLDPRIREVVQKARYLIRQLLGDVDSTTYAELARSVRLTSGATEDRTRRRSYPFLKVTGRLRAPPTAFPYLRALLRSYGVEEGSVRFTPVVRNTVVLVPKNWKTHRTIAKEPTHSLPFQLALDSLLKKKLRRWGVDLSSQKPNQDLAREGSLTGAYSTIDLEMASDTLSVNTVAWLIPDDWYVLLKDFRSSGYTGVFGRGWYAKFSSMGNGYTFSLETLIFAAVLRAVGISRPVVYGDDIVVPTELAPVVVDVLNFLGFSTNAEKSCISATPGFRESCGTDWYRGELVTPFYMRESPRIIDKAALSHTINGLIRISHPGPLWDRIRGVIQENRVRVVPFNDDTMSGVFVDIPTAYALRLLKTHTKASKNRRPWVPYFKGYGVRQTLRCNYGRRSLMLWHIARALGVRLDTASETPSRVSAKLLAGARHDALDDVQTSIKARSVMKIIHGGSHPKEVSKNVVRVSYVHKERSYSPCVQTVPPVLHLWSDWWMGWLEKSSQP